MYEKSFKITVEYINNQIDIFNDLLIDNIRNKEDNDIIISLVNDIKNLYRTKEILNDNYFEVE